MADIRIVVVYGDELEYLQVDGMELDVSAIQDKPIKDWFRPSNGRDGWEGLIEEIQNVVDDEHAQLRFEFRGPSEHKAMFEECIGRLGFGSGKMDPKDVARLHLEDAEKAEHRGFDRKAFQNYVYAADYGKNARAQYKAGEYYLSQYRGEVQVADYDRERCMEEAVDYYEKAAEQGYVLAQ